tara:strand:+ start:3197 stop:4447 length:1251 start_codon:yes stop_codon:yes gene_type:complete
MKALMEQWQRFINEDSLEKEFSLLLEQELNEAGFQQAKDWFINFFKQGGKKKDAENRIDQVADQGRREFLRGAFKAALVVAAVSAVGMPKKAAAAAGYEGKCEATVPFDAEPIPLDDLIAALYKTTIELYKPGNPNGDKMIRLFVELALKSGKAPTSDDLAKGAEFYEKKLYPVIVKELKDLVFNYKIVSLPDHYTASVRVGYTPEGDFRVIDLQLNSKLSWEIPGVGEDWFKRETGLTRCNILSHEFVHAVASIVKSKTGSLIDVESEAIADLGEIFDIKGYTARAEKFRAVGDSHDAASHEEWGNSIAEYYAELKGLRDRLGGTITIGTLQELCRRKADLEAGAGQARPDKYTINKVMLLKLKCPPTSDKLDAANRFAALDLYGDQKRTSAFAEEIEFKGMKSLMESWRKFNEK